jgi:signal peptidase I
MNLLKLFSNQSTVNQVMRNIVIIAIFFSGGSMLANHYGIHFNLSNSFKEKVFVIKKHFNKDAINKYDYISALPPLENNYIPDGEKIIKQIVCVEGQELVSSGGKFYCDGELVAVALNKDSSGNAINHFSFNGTIPKNSFFVIGDNPKSYDSRYFGFIERDNVMGVAIWRF